MGVSKRRGTPKWMVKIMENPIQMDDLGIPLFSETSIIQKKQKTCFNTCFIFFLMRRMIISMSLIVYDDDDDSLFFSQSFQKHISYSNWLLGFNCTQNCAFLCPSDPLRPLCFWRLNLCGSKPEGQVLMIWFWCFRNTANSPVGGWWDFSHTLQGLQKHPNTVVGLGISAINSRDKMPSRKSITYPTKFWKSWKGRSSTQKCRLGKGYVSSLERTVSAQWC